MSTNSEILSALAVGEKSPLTITVKSLIEVGAHFGHQTDKWNPKMIPFIFGERNGVHIINLDTTVQKWAVAQKYIAEKAANGGTILFVGTKQQSREIIAREAKRCGAFYVSSRWLGGTLTNFQTIKKSLDRMKKMEDLLAEAEKPDTKIKLNKKEKLNISRQLEKLNANIGGIRAMKRQPDMIFVFDIQKEDLAVAEAKKLHIPVVALVDTNTNPQTVSYPIPANDDASKTIELFAACVADTIIDGHAIFKTRAPKVSFEQNSASAGESNNGRRRGGNSGGRSRDSKDNGAAKGADATVAAAAPTTQLA